MTAAADIVSALSREDKIRLVSGRDFWTTEPVAEHGIEAIMVSDGPHGLRKQGEESDHVGVGESVPATCFPPAVTMGSTWDPSLQARVGAALGRETRGNDVAVLLGPGLNIKRHPQGGRNFEYFSEDPFLAGHSAAALTRGIQSEGVGACLKHYAANNQEAFRMRLDTIVDERTLREIYLAGFEIAVKESSPWTVMCAYNLVNGEHADASKRLLTDILRDEWGFDGLVMSDWFAVSDRITGIAAGLDLEMPGSSDSWDARIGAAIDDGSLSESDLDTAVRNVVELVLRAKAGREAHTTPMDHDAHHALAREAAAAGTVLLANDGTLPLAAPASVALIGSFAEAPRYQGAGSSQVNPTRLTTVREALAARLPQAQISYASGYDPKTGETTEALVAEAVAAAQGADVAIVMIGLPSAYESEGFDRPHMNLPPGHDAVVAAVAATGTPVVATLSNGSPVALPWAGDVAAIVEGYLGGQAAGEALVDVLVGDAEPGGRLAESFPVAASDLPSHANFTSHPTLLEYREGPFVGYRFHDTFDVAPAYPFGHGLSYTSFELGEAYVAGEGTALTVSVPVANTGARAGSTVVQLYVADLESSVMRPAQELKGYRKVALGAGESTVLEIELDDRSFAVYDVADAAWKVEAGAYEIRVGVSSREITSAVAVDIASDDVVTPAVTTASPVANDDEYRALLGRELPSPAPIEPFRYDSVLADLDLNDATRAVKERLTSNMSGALNAEGATEEMQRMMEAMMKEFPLRAMVYSSDGQLTFDDLDELLDELNS